MPTTPPSSDEHAMQHAILRRAKANDSFVQEKAREDRAIAAHREKTARMIARARAKQAERYRKWDEKDAQKAAYEAANPTYGRSGVKKMDTIEAQHWEFKAVAALQRVQAVGLVVLGGAAMGLAWQLFDKMTPLAPNPSTAQVAMDFAQFAGSAMVGFVGAFTAGGGIVRAKDAFELDSYRQAWVDYRLPPDAESQAKLAAAKQSMPSVNFVGRLLGLREAKKSETPERSNADTAQSPFRPAKKPGV